uniref:Leucine rich repeat containing 24 n=1 Tax=Saimiri boliviensis boliviensis TaxID=39432 RepID=A0A2K6T5V7_SAIBB
MAPGGPASLLLLLLLLPPPPLPGLPSRAAGCPVACRCYSATVECGALRLRVVPLGIPPGTQTLFLQDNNIARLEPGALAPLSALRRLYLHNNSLRALEAGAFRAQPRLLELALTSNRLRGLRSGAFLGLAQLRVLYLAGNQLARLLDFTFLHLPVSAWGLKWRDAPLWPLRLQELHLRNQLGTISREALQPLASLQVLRLTENPWRCDCALHWLGAWIKEGGQRLLSSRDRKIMCAEPPRLALQSLLDISHSSLICIPPSVHVQPLELTANLGEDLRVACQASGYPQPLVTWRKVPQPREGRPRAQAQLEGGAPVLGGHSASDTGSGMLFLSNITLAHAGKYECEASNAGGEGALFVNDYLDGPCTFAQLEELRDERGHEMFVINRSKPLFAEVPAEAPADCDPAEGATPGLRVPPPVAYEIHC